MTLHFSILLQARKLKELQDSGRAVPYAGQLGRAQQHYTVDDTLLMNRVWAEDLWPVVREKLRQRGMIVGAVPPPGSPGAAADGDPGGQRDIASFFARSEARALRLPLRWCKAMTV